MSSRQDAPVAVLSTLDTKAAEAGYVASVIRSLGREALVVDIGLGGEARYRADVSRQEVAAAGGAVLGQHAGQDKAPQLAAMRDGAIAVLRDIAAARGLGGVIGLGGGQGSWLCSGAMRALQRGIPKVLVSTAGASVGQFTQNSDIVPFYSVTDLAGLNRLLTPVLHDAAVTVCALAGRRPDPVQAQDPAVALSMYGVTTAGGTIAKSALEAAGLEVLTFHANGAGGATMEQVVAEGVCAAVLDWSITELADDLVGGICSAGDGRLLAAARTGIPQVVVPGGIDVVNVGQPRDLGDRFPGRILHLHTPDSALLRTDIRENTRLGKIVADRVNGSAGPVALLLPEGGFSALSTPSGPFWWPEADEAFMTSVGASVGREVEVTRLLLHINDPEFARAAAAKLISLRA
jgi:uncharacterized protein (UPF0261 family)